MRRFYTTQSNWRDRARFYKRVTVSQNSENGLYQVELDGRRLKTPSQQLFTFPTKQLADLVALEWDSQICTLQTSTMPLTMTCATALDVTATRRTPVISELLRYLNTDMVCFPKKIDETENSGESEKLFALQKARWGKALNYFISTYGDLEILDSDTLKMPKHPEQTILKVQSKLEKLNDLKLTAVHELAKGCKSLVVPISVIDRQISTREAVDATRTEEEHQIKNWGLVEGAHDVDEQNLLVQLSSASLIFWLTC